MAGSGAIFTSLTNGFSAFAWQWVVRPSHPLDTASHPVAVVPVQQLPWHAHIMRNRWDNLLWSSMTPLFLYHFYSTWPSWVKRFHGFRVTVRSHIWFEFGRDVVCEQAEVMGTSLFICKNKKTQGNQACSSQFTYSAHRHLFTCNQCLFI